MKRLDAVRSLGPVDGARIAAWKVRQAIVRRVDRANDYSAFTRRSDGFADRWLREWRPRGVAAWLQRPGAGRLWLSVDEAAGWCRATCAPADLALADATARGSFDLLGSGPRALGSPPAWRRDLYSGVEWPLEDAATLGIVPGDGSDVRTVWELSRCYHFTALARAWWTTGERRFAHAFVDHVESWIEQNPIGRGPHWASPMDAAIRVANWSLAVVLFAEADVIAPSFWARMLGSIVGTAAYVERYREWHPRFRGNHYVADLVGLVYAGALFADTPAGVRWLRRGARRLAHEIERQVHADGVSFEGALGYHRLVTELFAFGGMVAHANGPGLWPDTARARLAAMYDFIDAYLQPDGAAPMLGDADDGRLHWLSADAARHPRRHALGLPDRADATAVHGAAAGTDPARARARDSRLFPDGGFAVITDGSDHAVVRCGRVGLHGAGSHDHNDQLSVEIVSGGTRIVRDSGTYCYTRDLARRHAFRSTAAHNAVQLDDLEQNPIRVDAPWRVLADRTRSRVLAWEVKADEVVFEGEHHGYADRGALVRRRIVYTRGTRTWAITDRVVGTGAAGCAWRLHLDAPVTVLRSGAGVLEADVGGVRIAIGHPPALAAEVVDVASSDAYGASSMRPCIVLRGPIELPLEITTTLAPRASG